MGWIKSAGQIASTVGMIWSGISNAIKAHKRRKTIAKNNADCVAAVDGLRKSPQAADGSDGGSEGAAE